MRRLARGRFLVTGCSSGLGRATALHLAEHGHRVVGTLRQQAHDESTNRSFAGGGSFDVVEIDVRDGLSVRRGVEQAVELLGGLDGLVNNAGISHLSAVEDLHDDDLQALFDTNCAGVLRMSQAVLPQLRQAGGGTIVNVSSMNALAAFPFTGGYAASKAAMEALSEALALEVDRFGIRVALVQPGVFDTDIERKSLPRRGSSWYVGEAEALEAGRASALAAAPPLDDVAGVIEELLLSEDPEFRTAVGRDARGIARRRREMTDREFHQWIRGLSSTPSR